MGVDDLIDDDDDDEDETSPDSTDEVVNNLTPDDYDVEYTPDTDYEQVWKNCPRCFTPGKKTSSRTWECPDDECLVSKYTMSWYEWRGFDGWLSEVDFVEVYRETH